ncbi:MAG: serine/threonine protein kinase [Myxococcales bacterium]|nr:serine/threonine protein kinase [Myxococcales bacterium]
MNEATGPGSATKPPEIVGGRYLLGKTVGSGSSGAVYLARDRHTGERYAVKVREAREREQPVRFIAEAHDMARLRHPRLVPVLDRGNDDNLYWFVMPYYEKGSLRDRVKHRGPLRADLALSWTFQILEGLAVVHQAGLVHRDVKPHNVLLNEAEEAVLTDFGLVRHVHGGVPYRTRTDQSMGTPNYRAPEQAVDAATVDLRADIYGVGATLYFLLTARRPGFLYMVDGDDPAMDAVPPVMRPFVLRCMAYDARDRYPNAPAAAVVVADLADVLARQAGKQAPGDLWRRRLERRGKLSLWQRIVRWVGQ